MLQQDDQKYRLSKSALQELPYNGENEEEFFENLNEGSFNSSLSAIPIVQEKPSSFMPSFKGLVRGANKVTKYAFENLGLTITMGLASQVAASAALNF